MLLRVIRRWRNFVPQIGHVRDSCCANPSSAPGSSTDPPDSAFTVSAVLQCGDRHTGLSFNLGNLVRVRSISDESATKAYAELAVPVIESFGGRFLVRTFVKIHAHEAGLQQQTIIVEFDSYETALATYESEAYKKALQALGSGAERDLVLLRFAALSGPNLGEFPTKKKFWGPST